MINNSEEERILKMLVMKVLFKQILGNIHKKKKKILSHVFNCVETILSILLTNFYLLEHTSCILTQQYINLYVRKKFNRILWKLKFLKSYVRNRTKKILRGVTLFSLIVNTFPLKRERFQNYPIIKIIACMVYVLSFLHVVLLRFS